MIQNSIQISRNTLWDYDFKWCIDCSLTQSLRQGTSIKDNTEAEMYSSPISIQVQYEAKLTANCRKALDDFVQPLLWIWQHKKVAPAGLTICTRANFLLYGCRLLLIKREVIDGKRGHQ